MSKEIILQIKKELKNNVSKERLFEIIDLLIEDNCVKMDTMAAMQLEIDELEAELEFYRTESFLGF